jgi:integrase
LTGCRFSEAARLSWEHVDLTRRVALFPETKNRDPREVYLADPLFEMLERRGPGATGELVFVGASGRPYTQPPRLFRTVVEELGLNQGRSNRDRVCFHTLRHTAATLAARRGTPVKDLQLVFGWRTPSMVFRYSKGSEAIQKQALEGVAQTLVGESARVIPLRKRAAQ